MRAERKPIEDAEFEIQADVWWDPFTLTEDLDPERDLTIHPDRDEYVVVEEIEDGRVVFEVSSWPRVDKGGRLVFKGEPREIVYDVATAQQQVDQAREGHAVVGKNRPLRPGDVFAVRDLAADARTLGESEIIWDISLAARNEAKKALYGAAASTVEEDYVAKMAIEDAPEEEPVRGEFDVIQQYPLSKQQSPARDEGEEL